MVIPVTPMQTIPGNPYRATVTQLTNRRFVEAWADGGGAGIFGGCFSAKGARLYAAAAAFAL